MKREKIRCPRCKRHMRVQVVEYQSEALRRWDDPYWCPKCEKMFDRSEALPALSIWKRSEVCRGVAWIWAGLWALLPKRRKETACEEGGTISAWSDGSNYWIEMGTGGVQMAPTETWATFKPGRESRHPLRWLWRKAKWAGWTALLPIRIPLSFAAFSARMAWRDLCVVGRWFKSEQKECRRCDYQRDRANHFQQKWDSLREQRDSAQARLEEANAALADAIAQGDMARECYREAKEDRNRYAIRLSEANATIREMQDKPVTLLGGVDEAGDVVALRVDANARLLCACPECGREHKRNTLPYSMQDAAEMLGNDWRKTAEALKNRPPGIREKKPTEWMDLWEGDEEDGPECYGVCCEEHECPRAKDGDCDEARGEFEYRWPSGTVGEGKPEFRKKAIQNAGTSEQVPTFRPGDRVRVSCEGCHYEGSCFGFESHCEFKIKNRAGAKISDGVDWELEWLEGEEKGSTRICPSSQLTKIPEEEG